MEREGCGDRPGGCEVLMDAVSARPAVLELSMGPGHREVAAKGLDNVTPYPMGCPPWGKQGADVIPRETPTFRG